MAEDQQFCLRWNNFQSYITSQFESLRDEEDFVDVTLACGGQRLGAHKVVLSACSPFFKELFKVGIYHDNKNRWLTARRYWFQANPCPHPIIFMRDVEVQHVVSLLEFMYAGEVNVAQANLSGFLRTAESLQIRGLTDAARPVDDKTRVTSTQGVGASSDVTEPKREETINPFAVNQLHSELELVEPKLELPDYSEDEASREDKYMDVDGTAAAVLSVGDSTPGTSAPVDIHHTHGKIFKSLTCDRIK